MDMTHMNAQVNQAALPPPVDLLQNLLTRASERRSLHLLAMAFRLKYPRWGSQSVLITMGLAGFLEFIDWNFSNVEYHIPDLMDEMDTLQTAQFRSLKLTQIRHLAELNAQDVYFTLRPADNTEQSKRLTDMANQGYMLYELREVMLQEMDCQDYNKLRPLLEGLTLEAYMEAVHPDDRHMHPNALDERVMHFKRRVLDVSNEYSPKALSLTRTVGAMLA